MLGSLVIVSLLTAPLLSLEHRDIRVEVDPQIFSVRFIGMPGGHNFVEPLPVDDDVRSGDDWCDPGGLTTDVAPLWVETPALRRGPAEVLESTETRIVLMSPKVEGLPLRLKKEFRLLPREGRVLYRATLLSLNPEPVEANLRNAMRLPLKSTVRVERDEVELKPLAGAESIFPAVVKSSQYWLLPAPPSSKLERVVIGGYVPGIQIEHRRSVLFRRIVTMPGSPLYVPHECTFLSLLDSETHSYGAVLQGANAQVSAASPLTFAETWEIIKK